MFEYTKKSTIEKSKKKKQIWKSEQKKRDWLTKSVNGSELNTFFKSDDLIITYNILFWVFLCTCIAQINEEEVISFFPLWTVLSSNDTD